MMAAMSVATALIFCTILAAAGTGSAVLLQLNAGGSSSVFVGEMITRFVGLLALSTCGTYASRQGGLRGSLVLTSEDSATAIRDFMIYGALPGFVLGVINFLLFYGYRYDPVVQPEIRNMDSLYDAFVISLDAAMSEEILYRLFILSALLFFFRQAYVKILSLWPVLGSVLPAILALVVSSLLFAVAHNIYGFTAAFAGGLVLGIVFLKSGLECAIVGHFVADVVFFSASYLS
jgi:membrane protease YdiL (CAAX protease family)